MLVPLTAVVMWAERPLHLLPAGVGPAGPWSPAILTAGMAAAMVGLARLAIAGFAPTGNLPGLVLAVYASGLLLTLLSGHPPPVGTAALRTPQPHPSG